MRILTSAGRPGVRLAVGVELSRRNLDSLLAKLNGYPADSSCSIIMDGFLVRAVENEMHYSDRLAGEMHPATEHVLPAQETKRYPLFLERALCPECKSPGMWCKEHNQQECSNGNCDHVGELSSQEPKPLIGLEREGWDVT